MMRWYFHFVAKILVFMVTVVIEQLLARQRLRAWIRSVNQVPALAGRSGVDALIWALLSSV